MSANITSHHQSGGFTAGTVNFGAPPPPAPPSWKKRVAIVGTLITVVGGAVVGVYKKYSKEDEAKPTPVPQTVVNVTNNNTQTATQTATVAPTVKVTSANPSPPDSPKTLPVAPRRHRPPPRKAPEMSDKPAVFNVNSFNQTGGITAGQVVIGPSAGPESPRHAQGVAGADSPRGPFPSPAHQRP